MKKLLIFVIILLPTILQSQSIDNDKAHRRYWYYRTRMINDFMKIGKNQGNGLVFAERNRKENNDNQPELISTVGPDQIDITNQYMIALALEYKLLSRNNQDVSETVKELFHLLYTFNRLDLEAEQFRGPAYPSHATDYITPNGILNGFALREDMPRNDEYFTANNNENLLHFNYQLAENNFPNTPNPTDTYTGFTGVQHTNTKDPDSKFSYYYDQNLTNYDDMFLPQDKYHSLLVALMFITKYIPDNTTFSSNGTTPDAFQDGLTGIKEEAKNIASRCYNYLSGPSYTWTLKMLDLNGNSTGSIGQGSDAKPYSWPFSREACMANKSFPWNAAPCPGYDDPYSVNFGFPLYSVLSLVPGFTKDLGVFQAWTHAGSNSTPVTGIPISIGMSVNTSFFNLKWAELLRKVLHQNQVLYRQLQSYASIIDVAPCKGPYNYGSCVNGGFDWSSQDRNEHPEHMGDGCDGKTASDFYGNYPGVDYMLLHNLYYEYQNQIIDGNQGNATNDPSSNVLSYIYNYFSGSGSSVYGNGASGSNYLLPGYKYAYNYMDNLDANMWPRTIYGAAGTSISGTTFNPSKVAVFQNLKSVAHIYFNTNIDVPSNTIPSDVTYRAGKEISLLPGFQVDAGSNFHAYILRYVCTDNADALNMRHIQDSATLANAHIMDYEADEMNPIPMHYIESPKSDADKTPVVPINSEDDNSLPLIADGIVHPASEFTMQPNPSTGIFKVFTQKEIDNETLSIHIYDMRGQLINSYTDVTPEFEINLSGYSKGIYMVQLISTTGKVSSKRVDIIE